MRQLYEDCNPRKVIIEGLQEQFTIILSILFIYEKNTPIPHYRPAIHGLYQSKSDIDHKHAHCPTPHPARGQNAQPPEALRFQGLETNRLGF